MKVRVNISLTIPFWLDKILVWPLLQYRRLRFGFPFRKIPLGKSLFTIVDPDDHYQLNCFHWSERRNSNCIYAVRFLNDPRKKPKIISMHRQIINPRKGLLVDHVNRNTLDNRKANLRLATKSQNMQNRGKISSKTSSRFIGVYLERRTGRWVSCIEHHSKKISLGTFGNEIDAAKAYDKAAKKHRGEFARLNFPEGVALGDIEGRVKDIATKQ